MVFQPLLDFLGPQLLWHRSLHLPVRWSSPPEKLIWYLGCVRLADVHRPLSPLSRLSYRVSSRHSRCKVAKITEIYPWLQVCLAQGLSIVHFYDPYKRISRIGVWKKVDFSVNDSVLIGFFSQAPFNSDSNLILL